MWSGRTGAWMGCAIAVCAVAGCSDLKGPSDPVAGVDANAFPTQYQLKIAKYLLTELTDQADFRGAMISQPAIKPVGTSTRYVVCVRLNGHNQRKDKVAVFLSGTIIQFLAPTPEQCGDAQYEPFRDLDAVAPGG